MSSVLHGRRRSSANRKYEGQAQGETIFKLSLNAPDDPESFQLPFQMVASEYATRYLEQIGVKPSKSTLDMVHKNIPLTDHCVKTTFRAKGHVTDEVQITVPPVQHKFNVPQVISAHSIAQLGMNNKEGPRQGEANLPIRQGSLVSVSGLPLDDQTGPGVAFKRLASRYLHPFNLDVNLSKENVARIRAIARGQQGEADGNHASSPSTEAADAPLDDGAMLHAMKEELAEELVVTPEVVLTVLSPLEAALVDWHKAQAAETLKDRLGKEDFQATIDLLLDDWTINFFVTAINFLHTEFVEASPYYCELGNERKLLQQQSMTASHSALGSRRGRGGASTSGISRATALQQFDMGYKMFMEEKMEELKTASLKQKERPNTGMLLQASLLRVPMPSAAGSMRSLLVNSRFPSMDRPDSGGGRVSPSCSTRSTYFASGAEPDTPASFAVTVNTKAMASPFFHQGGYEHMHDASQMLSPMFSASRGGKGVMFDLKSPEAAAAGRGSGSIGGGLLLVDEAALQAARSADGEAVDFWGDAGTPLASRRSARLLPSVLAATSAARSLMDTLDAQDMARVQQTRLFTMQKDFAALFKKQRQERAGMFFRMPILLLFLRLGVSMLFTSLYPLWCKTRDGTESLEKMDDTLVHLFDPHGYLQRNLSILQSTPAAVSILTKYPHKGHEAEHTHFSDISPLLRATLTEPGSVEARRLLHQARKAQGKAPIKTRLTKAQMQALYQDARSVVGSKNAKLSKLGEPVQPTTRDSWIPKPDVVR